MKSKYLLVILTLSIILTLNVACASEVWDETLELDETTYEISVDETQTEPVAQEETGTFKELADTITSTSTGEELKLNKSYEHASTDSANPIRITKSITIDGDGNTIDAKKSTGIFTVSADNVVLKNIIFKNAYSTSSGSCISARSAANLTIINCTFEESYSGNTGGAVYVFLTKNTLISGSRFISNQAAENGGALYESQSTDFTVIDSYFESNTAKLGGATYIVDSLRENITDCVFNSNNASKGGAFYWFRSKAGSLSNNKFEDNYATEDGGAVYVHSPGLIQNSTFKSNGAYYSGGAVYWTPRFGVEQANLKDSTFKGNNASSGGALFFAMGYGSNVTNCTFNDNHADLYGGAAHFAGNLGKGTTLSDSRFNNNTGRTGGAVYWANYGGSIINNEFTNNEATEDGGSLYVYQRDCEVRDCSFEDSYAPNGGSIYWISPTTSRNSNAVLANSTFKRSKAGSGGVAYIKELVNITVSGCTIEDTEPATNGGIFFLTKVTDALFRNVDIEGAQASGTGGAIYATSGSIILENFNLTGSKASNGGAFYFYNMKTALSNVNIEDVKTTSNGGIYAYLGSLSMDSVNVSGASANNGGALYLYNVDASIMNSQFHRNNATVYGGAIYAYMNKLDIENTDFADNRAGNYGGAIIIMGNDLNIDDSSFHGNNASYGSAIFKSNSATANITGTVFAENQASANKITITNVGKNFTAVFTGCNNILNAIWNSDGADTVTINGQKVVNGAENSMDGALYYQDNREANQTLMVYVTDSEGKGLDRIYLTTDLYGRVFYTAIEGEKISVFHYLDKYYTYAASAAWIPDYSLSKVSIKSTVINESTVEFEIIIKNTGKKTLNDIIISEDYFEGLTYIGWDENDAWTNDGLTWKLNSHLVSGEVKTIKVRFRTTDVGVYHNNISAIVDTMHKSASANVTVIPDTFDAIKVALIPVTKVGDQTIFEIVVHNKGLEAIHNVYVVEESFDGLVFDHTVRDDLWDYRIIDGKHTWILKESLYDHEYAGIFLVFNTTSVGNFTNYATVGHEGHSMLVNASVLVNETVHAPDIVQPNLTVSIETINPLIMVGNQTMFEIVVHNTGNIPLTKVNIEEYLYNGLIFHDFIIENDMWDYTPKTIPQATRVDLLQAPIVNDHTWTMNTPLFVNEYLGFFVVFNTTETGVFYNTILGHSVQTPNKQPATDVVRVVHQNYTLEKVALVGGEVKVGDEVRFEIIIMNNGEVDLTDITVEEQPGEGLEYLKSSEDSDWINEGMTWRLNATVPINGYTTFVVHFKVTKAGNLTNIAVSGDKTAEANVTSVEDENQTDNETDYEDEETISLEPEDEDDYTSIGTPLYEEPTIENEEKTGGSTSQVDKNATGNPLLALVVVLVCLVLIRRRDG